MCSNLVSSDDIILPIGSSNSATIGAFIAGSCDDSTVDTTSNSSFAGATVNISNPIDSRQSTIDYRAALWAIGHIGSTEQGIAQILERDSNFIMWCLDQVMYSPILSIRGTCFFVLGLMSRTEKGSYALHEADWHAASLKHVAVAVPQEKRVLFEPMCGHGIYGHMIGDLSCVCVLDFQRVCLTSPICIYYSHRKCKSHDEMYT